MKNLHTLLHILFVLVSFTITNQVKANKVMASDLTWKCIGQDSFLVKLVVYRDCNGDFLISTPIIFKNTITGTEITRLNPSIGSPVDITPMCSNGCTRCQSSSCSFPYGIHKYTMQGIVRLDGAGSCCNVKISWSQCCRNLSITTGASGANFYTEATLNRCQKPCDNSPTFTNEPIAILCVDQDFTYCQGTQDIDINSTGGLADSLDYKWVKPLQAVNTSIPYSGSYDSNKAINFWGFPNEFLPFPRGIHLNPESGCIQFRPTKAEVTVMSIKVSEYRNGVKIAELRREMQVIVIPCTSNNPPNISTPNNVRAKSVCAGDTVSFEFSSTDPNTPDTVTLSWNGAIPGAVWTTTNGKAKHPTSTLSWTPNDAHVNSLPYTFTVTAKDNSCPIPAKFIQSYQITVKPRPRANIIVTDSGSGNFYFKAQRIQGSAPVYLWIGQSFMFSPDTGSVVQHKFIPGTYPYTMTMTAGGCSNTYYDTVIYDTNTSVRINNNKTAQSDFIIYPNPASDYVTITYQGSIKWEGKLMLLDPNHKLLLNRQMNFDRLNKSFSLPLNGYSQGMYLFKLENKSGSFLYKLIVQ